MYCLFCPKDIFLTCLFYLNVHSVLNTLSEYTYQKAILHTLFSNCFENRQRPSMYP